MKQLSLFLALAVTAGIAPAYFQGGPNKESTETVAKPRRPATKDGQPAPEQEQPKIPSKFGKKEGAIPEGPSFRSDVNTVNLDVAVVDNKGNFIPKIPKELSASWKTTFRKPVSDFGLGEGPMTVCMVIEFSNLYQQYWTETWYQTLTLLTAFWRH